MLREVVLRALRALIPTKDKKGNILKTICNKRGASYSLIRKAKIKGSCQAPLYTAFPEWIYMGV